MKTILLIDGENFKGYIKEILKQSNGKSSIKIDWSNYDFKRLLAPIIKERNIDKIVFYFSRIKFHKETGEKSKELIEERRHLKTHLEKQGFEISFAGRIRGMVEKVGWGRSKLVFKEKGVDVRIAVDMVSIACDKNAEEIILGSSDSDLQPAVDEIKKRGIKFTYLGFESNPNKGLLSKSKGFILLRNTEVVECEFVTKPLV